MTAPLRACLVLAGLAAALLAGCSNPPSPQQLEATGAAGAGASVAEFRTLGHAGMTGTLHAEQWANGTVSAKDTCNTGGCTFGTDMIERTVDLTPLVVAGVPTRVEADLDFKANPIGFGGFSLGLRGPASTVYGYRVDDDFQGHIVLQAIFVPREAVAIVMTPYGPGGDVPETAYTLRVSVDADEHGVPPGVPMAVHLEGGRTLRAAAPNGDPAPFLLYGPDDALLGTFHGNDTLAANAPEGDYVLVLPSDGPWGNLSADAGTGVMKALGLRKEAGPVSTLPPNGVLDAPWDVSGTPLGVGFELDSTTPLMASVGVQASLHGPNGFVFDPGSLCNVCLTGGFRVVTDSGTGDPAVTAGTYTVHGETQATIQASVTPFAIYLQR